MQGVQWRVRASRAVRLVLFAVARVARCATLRVLLAATLLAGHGSASLAQSESPQARGLDWLVTQVTSNGSLANESSSPATALQARSEAVRTLVESGRAVPPVLLQALQSLVASEADPIARQAVALRAAGVDATALETKLLALQSADGGVAAHAQGPATVLDTAWTLRAVASRALNADLAVSWLRLRQNAAGIWDAAPRSPLVTSAIALRALRDAAPRNPDATAAASLAAGALMATRRADGTWDSSVWVNALVFDAVHDFLGGDAAPGQKMRDWLLAAQSADGSWNQDPFATALAIRALRLAGVAPNNPSQSALATRVVDTQTGAALSGVAMNLQGPSVKSAVSDNEGRIAISGLVPGNYTATLTLATYSQQLIGFALAADRTTDLGRIQLSRSATTGSTTARLGGRVSDSTGAPIPEATVSLGAAATQLTDAQGRYLFANVAPGSYVITVAKTSFLNAATAANLPAGAELDFSPSLQTANAGSGNPGQGCRVYGHVRRASDGAPIAGASVSLGGANVASATTDVAGAYLIGSLVTGRTTLSVAATGFDSVAGVSILACDVPNAYDFSPTLFGSGASPAGANTAALAFTLVNAATEQPLGGVAVRATPAGQAVRNLVTATDGRFTVDGLTVESVLIEVSASGFDGVSVSYQVEPLEAKDMGQLRLRQSGPDNLLPDLKLVSVRRGTAVTNPQTLQVSGALAVSLVNAGRAGVPRETKATAFIDIDRDGRFDPAIDRQLGQESITTLLAPNQTLDLNIPVAGVLPFRDAPIHVWLDSEQLVAELNETNNNKSTADAAEVQPSIGTFKPVLKWQWTGSTQFPDYNQVMMAPVIGRLLDTNGDGVIDARDAPVVAFVAFNRFGGTWTTDGVIRVVDGRDGRELLTIRDTTHPISAVSGLALADLDRDGRPEIVATTQDYRLVVYRNDGTKWWMTPPLASNSGYAPWGGVLIADLDGDGLPEVIFQKSVYNYDGSLKWVATGSFVGDTVSSAAQLTLPLAADLYREGKLNLVLGASVYSSTGQLLWEDQDGFSAVADFDGDGFAEIAVTRSGTLSLYKHTGQRLWQVSIPGGGLGGPPTIADMDGDGIPEIGVAGGNAYTVYRRDGSVLWSKASQDNSSQVTGSTVFDFDGDGSAEVLYADEIRIRAFKGSSGDVLWSIPNSSGTALEYPLVADVDGDGHADLIAVCNDYATLPNGTVSIHGVRVFQDENNSWVNTRSVWNQHAYSITNVNDDLTIPAQPQPPWLAHNTFRLNKRLDVSATAVADATASYVRVRDGGGTSPSHITVRVGNGGALSTPVGLKVAFFAGSGAVLGVVPTSRALGPGEYEDLGLDVSGSLAPIGQLRVVADDDGTGRDAITDFDRSNNTVQVDLSAVAVALNVGVATDKPAYTELDLALFTATVGNTGSFARDAQVRFSVETAAGQAVELLALPAPVNVAAGAQAGVSATWPAAGVLAGAYRVRAELIDAAGLVYASATTPFAVEASNTSQVASRISADRANYSAAQAVQLRSRVFNATANMLVEGLTATTVITDATGREMWRRAEAIVQLAPRTSREFLYGIAASGLSRGAFTATLSVHDASGGLRSQSSLTFNVLGTDVSGVGLRGTLSVPTAAVAVGQSASIGFEVLNAGNAALSGVPLKLRVVDPVAGALSAEYPFSATLPVGETFAAASNWAAAGAPGDRVAVLVAMIAGREVVLAQAAFRVIESAVHIELATAARVDRDARVLVLLSCPMGASGADDAACVAQRRAAIATVLAASSVPNRIVTTTAEFEAEFSCGSYNSYWISGGALKLSNQLAKELREAVRRGDGLLVDGVHDSRNQLLHPVAGVKQTGKLPKQGYTAQIEAGHGFDPGNLATLGQPTRFQLTTGTAVALFGSDPAIVVNHYGEGASVLLAFDYAAMLAATGGAAAQVNVMLADSALRNIASAPALVTWGDVTLVGAEVLNRGTHAADIEVRSTLPAGASFVDARPAPTQVIAATPSAAAQIVWRATLPVGGSLNLRMRVRIGATEGTLAVPFVVYSLSPGSDPQIQASAVQSLQVVSAAQPVDDAVAAIEKLAPTRANEANARDRALAAAQRARALVAQGAAAAAIGEWIKAADEIAGITSDDIASVAAAQLAVARALEAGSDRLCAP